MNGYYKIFPIFLLLLLGAGFATGGVKQSKLTFAETIIYVDSLSRLGHHLYLAKTDSITYSQVPSRSFYWRDSIFKPFAPIDDKAHVSVKDTILQLGQNKGLTEWDSTASVLDVKFSNGSAKRLFSSKYSEAVGYQYLKTLNELNCYFVLHYFEQYSDYLLLNRRTGHESFLCGYPIISPDKKIIACYHEPCDECGRGFQCSSEFLLYSVKEDSMKLIFEDTINWEPFEAKWSGDTTLCMKIAKEHRVYFVKLDIPVAELDKR